MFCGPGTDTLLLANCIRESSRASTSQARVLLYSSTRQPKIILLQTSPFYDALGRISGCALRASPTDLIQPLQAPPPSLQLAVDPRHLADAALGVLAGRDIGTSDGVSRSLLLESASVQTSIPVSLCRLPAPRRPTHCQPPFHSLAVGLLGPHAQHDPDAVPALPAFLAAPAAGQPPAAHFKTLPANPDHGAHVPALGDPWPLWRSAPSRPAAAVRRWPLATGAQEEPRPLGRGAGDPSPPPSPHRAASGGATGPGLELAAGGARAQSGARPAAAARGAPRAATRRGAAPNAAAACPVGDTYERRLFRRYTAKDRRDAAATAVAVKAAAIAAGAASVTSTSLN